MPNSKPAKIADDKVTGDLRAEVCDAYIAAGKPQPEKNWLYSRLIEAKLDHRQSQVDLQNAIGQIWLLGSGMTGDFQAGVHMAIEELCERLGIEMEVEESPSA